MSNAYALFKSKTTNSDAVDFQTVGSGYNRSGTAMTAKLAPKKKVPASQINSLAQARSAQPMPKIVLRPSYGGVGYTDTRLAIDKGNSGQFFTMGAAYSP